jgi:hypothetical protein
MLKDYKNASECLNRAETEVGQSYPRLKEALSKAMKAPGKGEEAVIVLKSGEKIKGAILSDLGTKVVVKGNIEISKENIASIKHLPTASEIKTEPETRDAPGKKKEAGETPAAVEPGETVTEKKNLFVRLFGKFNRKRSFSIKLNFNYMQPRDVEFRDIYGSWFGFPEVRIGYRMTQKLVFWFRYGELTGDAYLPVLEEDAESSQTYISFGLGYRSRIKGKFSYTLELGLLNSRYLERAMGEEITDSALGFRLDGGFRFDFSKLFFADLTVSFLYATSSVLGDESVGIGGLGAGFGFGVKF